MKPLRLELGSRRRWPFAAWLLLGAAVFVVADTGWRVFALRDEVEQLELAQQRVAGRASGRSVAAERQDPAMLRDVKLAEQIVQRLSLPWDDLFRAIETASSDKVALLAVEPDSQRGDLSISGEAADYQAILAYLTRLDQPGRLQGVHLVRHEIKQDDPQRPVTFTISATWRPPR